MVKEAEAHAAEDKARKEELDVKTMRIPWFTKLKKR